MSRRSVLAGTGSALPPRRVTNAELAELVDTTHEWIVERTGIHARHIAGDGETTATLATEAAKKAIAAAGVEPGQIGLIVLATATPDQTFPASATLVQTALGIDDCIAFDVAAVCTGFLYALSVADNMLKGGMADHALVIGSETFSRILDWEDRATCVLFGDGAGAVVLKAEEAEGAVQGVAVNGGRGILATRLHADGRHNDLLYVDGGASTTGTVGKLRMKGKEVFRHAVVNLAAVLGETLAAAGHEIGDIDWVVPHQANKRILDATARKLGLDPAKVIVTVDQHANTSAASVPLALDTAVRDGRIRPGDLVMLEAMGGGFTWGAALLRY
jgi:3-oxoacyl-[acyl-carrier-protein] synthase-3